MKDVQRILQESLKTKNGSGILFIDTNYLHSFHISDMDYISKICKLGRYDIKHVFEWHNNLERWYNDQTVRDHFGREIKPKQLIRTFDKIVNEGLNMIAGCITGQDSSTFHFHAIGEGEDLAEAFSGDTQLSDEIHRIDVRNTNEGGSMTRDGSTIYFVGNHPPELGTATITETGIFDTSSPATDKMLDHSVFDPGISHDQHEDSAGSTTVVYMCGI